MWELLPKLLAGGAAGSAIAVVWLYTSGTVVPGHVYRTKCDDCERERERAGKAEQQLIDTIPVLTQAYEQISRVPHVAEKVVTTAAAVVTEAAAENGGRKAQE